MAVIQIKLNDDQFKLLNTTDKWNIDEVPKENWEKIPGIQRLHDKFCIMASGSDVPGILNGMYASAGLDVLCIETRPKKGESEGNAYHYVIQERTDGKYIVGPYRTETKVPHWFDATDLDRYWDQGGIV